MHPDPRPGTPSLGVPGRSARSDAARARRLATPRLPSVSRRDAVRAGPVQAGRDADGAEPDLVFTHEVPDLDVIETQNIQGTVSVERNRELLPNRPTNPDFVYKVPWVRPLAITWPLLAYRQPMAMIAATTAGEGTQSRSLSDCLASFFGQLLEVESDSPAKQARPVRVAVSYAFALKEQERAQSRVSKSEAIILTRIPLALRAVGDFVPDRDLTAPDGLCPSLAKFLLDWADSNDVWGQGGSFCFDVTVYSNLSGSAEGDPKPLIELPDVRLPLSEIAPPA